MHRLFEVDSIEDFHAVAPALQKLSALDNDASFWICKLRTECKFYFKFVSFFMSHIILSSMVSLLVLLKNIDTS